MTDSEYMEITRLLDSLTDGADTLRVVYQTKTVDDKDKAIKTGGVITTREVATDKAKAHPEFGNKLFLLPDREINSLVAIINECTDWTSDKFKASVVYQKMQSFISATSDMPKRIFGIYKIARSKCLELMELIPGVYPDLYPPFIRELLDHPDYKKAVEFHDITPPFTWNGTIRDLAFWLVDTELLSRPEDLKVKGRTQNNWTLAHRVFRIKGEPVTADQLRNSIKH